MLSEKNGIFTLSKTYNVSKEDLVAPEVVEVVI